MSQFLKVKDNKIEYRLTVKELQLILFIRNEFRFGKVELIVHAGQPQKVVIKEPEVIFDGNLLDKHINKQ